MILSPLLRGCEHFPQETHNVFVGTTLWRLLPGQTFYQLSDLAPIKPQSMFLAAYIDEDLRVSSYSCFLHLAATDGALPFPLLRGSFLRAEDAVEECLRLFQTVRLKQKLELSGVEPHALAIAAIVKLDIMILDDYQVMFANRAFHSFQAS